MIIAEPKENYSSGYIKLYRSLKNKGWYKKSEYVHLWLHLLLKANHCQKEWLYKNKSFAVKPGQFITSRKALSYETGINQSQIERILKCFEIEQQIEQQNLFTSRLITITYWDEYQKPEQQIEQQNNSKITANEQQNNTNNNINNVNNDKNKEYKDIIAKATKPKHSIEEQMKELEFELALYRGEFPEQMLKEFYDYWTEPNQSKTKIKQKLQKTWDTKRRLNTWASNDKNFIKNGKPKEKSIWDGL